MVDTASAPEELAEVELSAGGWNSTLGEFILDWDDVIAAARPGATDFLSGSGSYAGLPSCTQGRKVSTRPSSQAPSHGLDLSGARSISARLTGR